MRYLRFFQFLYFLIPAAFIAGILLSFELWFPLSRSFPRAPVLIDLPANIILLTESLLSSILVVSLILITFKPYKRLFSTIAIGALCLLIFFDQMRLQPWVYQYLLMLSVLALNNWPKKDEHLLKHTIALLQLIVATLYFWSGTQKLNYLFIYETLPKLLTPLEKILPPIPLAVVGISIGLIEAFIGVGLLFKRTRKLCVFLAIICTCLF